MTGADGGGGAAAGRARLRALVAERAGLVVPGAFDAVSARLVERAGFPAVYMTGYGVAASRLGLPDLGFAGLAEMVDQARNMAAAVGIPLIADADTGYGNALQVRRTVRQYEAAGVAGLHLEDQQAPKRCGHLGGKAVVSREEFADRVRAAVEARDDPGLLVIARTDALAVHGFDDAVRRAEAAAAAGADVLFVEAPTSEAEVEALPRLLDRPLLFNYAPSGRSPLLPVARLRELGYAVILLPVDLLLAATRAMAGYLGEVRARDDVLPLADRRVPFAEFNDLIGVGEQLALARRYGAG
jgi:2-methylisocitrate lyase-like PEP mutase family enzyme